MDHDPTTSSASRSLFEPHPDRLPHDHPGRAAILDAHRTAVEAGAPGYLDPGSGLFVFTAAELARRPCCHGGCRHCPWV